MMKKILFVLFILSVSLSLMSAIGYADDHGDRDEKCDGGDCKKPPQAYKHTPLITLENNIHKRSEFEFKDETPFVYLRLKDIDKKEDLAINYVWTHGTDSYTQTETYSHIASLKNWQSLDIWDSVRATGLWTVTTSWGYVGKGCDLITRTSSFSVVTPEPVSAALFLIGGLALTTRKFFNKKKKSANASRGSNP